MQVLSISDQLAGTSSKETQHCDVIDHRHIFCLGRSSSLKEFTQMRKEGGPATTIGTT